MVDIPAGNVGENNIKGTITFMQDGEKFKIYLLKVNIL